MNSMNIKIKYFTDAIDRLAYIDGKSDWIDLRAAREVVLKKGDFALIPLGVAMEPDFTAAAAVRPIPTISTVPSRMRMISGVRCRKNVSSARS